MDKPLSLDPNAARVPMAQIEAEAPEIARMFRDMARDAGADIRDVAIFKRGDEYSIVMPPESLPGFENDNPRTADFRRNSGIFGPANSSGDQAEKSGFSKRSLTSFCSRKTSNAPSPAIGSAGPHLNSKGTLK